MAKIHYPFFERPNGVQASLCGTTDIISTAPEAQQRFLLVEHTSQYCVSCLKQLRRTGFDLEGHREAARRAKYAKLNPTIKV